MADLYGLPSADDEALKSGDPSIGKQILFGLLSSALGTQISAPRGASVAERLAVQKYGDEQTAAQAKAKREAEANAIMGDIAKYSFTKDKMNAEQKEFSETDPNALSGYLKVNNVEPELPKSLSDLGDYDLAIRKYSDLKPVEEFVKERDARGLEKKALSGIDKARSTLGETADLSTLASLDLSEGFSRSAPTQAASGAFAPIHARQGAELKAEEQKRGYGFDVEKENLSHKNAMELKQTAPGKAEGDPEGFGGSAITPQQASAEMQLRKEYIAASSPYRETKIAADKVRDASKKDTPAGDLAMIYGFMKAQDPGSTVRESEFAAAAKAGSLPEQITNYATSILRGTRLTPAQRKDFAAQTEGYLQSARKRQLELENEYTSLASQYGYLPNRIIGTRIGEKENPPITPPTPPGDKTDLRNKYNY